jgi:hypothetical protein
MVFLLSSPLNPIQSKAQTQQPASHSNLCQTYQRMMSVLHWSEWKWQHRGELVYTFYLVMSALWTWHRNLKTAELDRLFGASPLQTL